LINLSEPENLVELRNQILSKLFKWLILSNVEFKESGAVNVALKLNGLFKLTDDPKCLCLSLLLREVRSINASIRETSEKASQDDELQINQARMIEIQK
jgi:hypothetical protein